MQNIEVRVTYYFGNHLTVKLDVTHTLPVQIHVELDTFIRCLVDVYMRKSNGNMAKIELDKTQTSERTRKCGGKDWFYNLLEHFGTSDIDVRP